ncbi:MAG: NADH-quinone oxidoreductase subunit NuoG [Acidimicrobiia bacterium]
MSDAPPKSTVSVEINGHTIEANPGELVIDAAERNGVHIPRFCYHNRMRPVGMCRMCLVEIDQGRGPALSPSCMIPVTEGMKVDTESERTRKAQDGVLEFLLINHPLDCPVCDKGGECPLQDNTIAFGPGESRFVEEKRHYEKPIPISDLVFLDRERCILCDRCTRFAKEVAGDPLIHFQGRGARTEVNTFPDEPFASYFSGNTVQICPVGALTSSSYRFKARPWDLTEVESTCTTCSVGCSVTLQASRNRLLRSMGVDNDAVNWGWLCDRGRFDIEAVEAEARLAEPLIDGTPARWNDALRAAAGAISTALRDAGPSGIGVIGGARLTNESAYAWAKLAKGVIGTDNVDAQLGDGLPGEVLFGLPRATIAEACTPKGTIVLLGPDPKETLGVLYLRLRHAVVEDGATLIEIANAATGMTRHARHVLHGEPGGSLVDQATRAAELLPDGGPVTVVLGRTSLSEDPAVLTEAAQVLAAKGARFLPALVRGNVHGALDLGLAPGLLPGRVALDAGRTAFAEAWGGVPAARGKSTPAMLAAAADGSLPVLILLGADPINDSGDRALAERALERATVIAIDTFPNDSVAHAKVVLPAAGYGEVDGTTTNLEGRILPVRQAVTPPGTARADWAIAVELAARLEADLGFEDVAGIWAEIEAVSAAHEGITAEALATMRDGMVAAGTGGANGRPAAIADLPPVTAKRVPLDPTKLRLVVRRTMYDNATLTQQSRSLGQLPPANAVHLHPLDFEKLGVAEGAEVTLVADEGRLTLPVVSDDGVVRGSAVVLANVPDAPVNILLSPTSPVIDVRLEVVR